MTKPGVSFDDAALKLEVEAVGSVPLVESTSAACHNSVLVGVGLANDADAARSWSASGNRAFLKVIVVVTADLRIVVTGSLASWTKEGRKDARGLVRMAKLIAEWRPSTAAGKL